MFMEVKSHLIGLEPGPSAQNGTTDTFFKLPEIFLDLYLRHKYPSHL